MKIITILGTRPEITKLSPLLPLLDQEFDHKIIHTGQHYDHNMDGIFFDELQLRKPDCSLNVGSGTHAQQMASLMVKLEQELQREKPEMILTFGDTNTTFIASLVASRLHLPFVHLEAGCRSFNKKMPEEMNRIFADHAATFLFAPDEVAHQNLLKEGIPDKKIYVVGSLSIDATFRNINLAKKNSTILSTLTNNPLKNQSYAVLTLHRAENTDDPVVLKNLIVAFNQIAQKIPLIFPIHPRTRKAIEIYNLPLHKNICAIDPLGYMDMLALLNESAFVMTDSGGIQEEAACLNTPCLILRNEAEWTDLIDAGKNRLVGNDGFVVSKRVLELVEAPHHLQNMRKITVPFKKEVANYMIETIKRLIP